MISLTSYEVNYKEGVFSVSHIWLYTHETAGSDILVELLLLLGLSFFPCTFVYTYSKGCFRDEGCSARMLSVGLACMCRKWDELGKGVYNFESAHGQPK